MKAYHALSVDDTMDALNTSIDGISSARAGGLQNTYGKNVLPQGKKKTILFLLFAQVKSFLILILLIAAAISLFLQDYKDAVIILVTVVLNMIVGAIQEGRAERALDALKKVITVETLVLRDGKEMTVKAEDIVPGDILLLHAGEKIPADARLFEVSELETNEAALTGESIFVSKNSETISESTGVGDRTNMVFTGTIVTRGSGKAVVTAIGIETEIGRIAQLLRTTPNTATPIQKKLDRFAHSIGMIVLGISLIVCIIGVIKGMPMKDIFTVAVAIAVSAIPEGLVVAVTVILAIGMQRILQRHALVRNLQAAETLGSTSVICTDKTGTLTEGNMSVVSFITKNNHFDQLHTSFPSQAKESDELFFGLRIGMLCNDAHSLEKTEKEEGPTIVGNLTDRALLAIGIQAGLEDEKKEERRYATVPFDSTNKYMATLHDTKDGFRRVYIKGAPEKILAAAVYVYSQKEAKPLTSDIRAAIEKKQITESEKGLRLLGCGYKDVPKTQTTLSIEDIKDIVFVGFFGITDPLRPHIQETFQKTQTAGIITVMITGDHKITATAIASQIGLPVKKGSVIEGTELQRMSEKELYDRVQDISVYARVSPEDKLRIIQAWQSHDFVVAMTGDGVNDAPALKAADIGVALGSGTDVAKEASDMVLLDNNYTTIVAAVEEGRGIFDNIRKVILYLISDSFAEVIVITAALFIGIPLPLVAAQILWINLISDGLPGIAMTVEPKEKHIMTQLPRHIDEPVINREMKILTFFVSILAGLFGIAIFTFFYFTTENIDLARTVVFTFFAVKALLYVFSIRALHHSIFRYPLFSNKWLIGAIIVAFFIQITAIYVPFLQDALQTVPLGIFEWSVIILSSLLLVSFIEIVKYFSIIKPQKKVSTHL